jgi:ribosomal protection tetracycline resistance protein
LRTLNLGILAHVDAGKTSLTERLLYAAGVIDELGSVDDGSTQTDSLALERQRGITIKTAVVSFVVDDVSVNLIDTPGHPDFIAEVERVLSVLDGAVLVISAVEGVQAQTRLLMRTLQRLHIPTLIFVNKIDRAGAQYEGLLASIAEKLTPDALPMVSVDRLGTLDAKVTPFTGADANALSRMVNLLADHDDELLATYVDGDTPLPYDRLRGTLAVQAQRGCVHPVFFGSAKTGAGLESLTAGITELLPTVHSDVDGAVSGSVFKVERGMAGEKIAYARLFSGTVRTRDVLPVGGGDHGKVTAISVFDRGSARPSASVEAGQIAKLWGLGCVQIGDAIGRSRPTAAGSFAPPTLETVVAPRDAADRGALHVALAHLAEQDPLINVRQDELRREVSLSLFGEVQKEVIQATLANDFGVDVTFRASTTICIERPIGAGAAAEIIGIEPNPFLATVGLRIDPAPTDSGVSFRLGVELGSMPFSFFTAVEDAVRETLQQGLHGWQVTDCTVTMTHSGYWARQSHSHGTFDKSMSSTAGDFRNLTPLVLMSALTHAGTTVFEPMHRFRLELPAESLGPVLPVLARLSGIPYAPTMNGSSCLLDGELPAARVHRLTQQLAGLTRGEGVLESAFDHFRPVRGTPPSRPRFDRNPLNRKEYLLDVVRRVGR